MNVFVTGNLGYIGTHLVALLKQDGHQVTGCDIDLFNGCAWEEVVPPDVQLTIDTRKLEQADIDGYDCIMHLAAISNDPMGDLDASITETVNRDASIQLAKLAKQAGVPKFIFASSCSIYGKGASLDLDESAELNPLTAYARSKIEAETEIAKLADANFTPVLMRNATAYGHSPMLRIDLVVNNLLASALAYGEIRIKSDGKPWRPLIHCKDIARAMIAFMHADADIGGKPINVGGNADNYQVQDVGDQVHRLLPAAKVVFTGEVGQDPRDYRVKFDLLNQVLPEFQLAYNLASGMEELLAKMQAYQFSANHFESEQFVRLKTLTNRLDRLT